MNSQHQARRVRLIQPSLQMQLIWGFGAVTVIAIACQALVFAAVMTRFAASLPLGSSYIVAGLPKALMVALAVSVVLVVPSLVLLGVRMTFRIAGPLYRMEQHLRAVADGEDVEPCTIRKGDQLQDFCGLLNEALAAAEERGRQEHPATLKRVA